VGRGAQRLGKKCRGKREQKNNKKEEEEKQRETKLTPGGISALQSDVNNVRVPYWEQVNERKTNSVKKKRS